MGSSKAQGNVRRDLRLKLLFLGRGRSCVGMAPLCFWMRTKCLSFRSACSPLPAVPAPRPSVSSFPRPGRSSAPAYSSVMKRPLSRCRRDTVTLCVPSRSPEQQLKDGDKVSDSCRQVYCRGGAGARLQVQPPRFQQHAQNQPGTSPARGCSGMRGAVFHCKDTG